MKNILLALVFIMVAAVSLSAQGLSIGSGTTFSLGASTLYLPNNWSNAGTFIPGTGTVVLNGSVDQTITNASGETFLDLSVNKPSGDVVLNSNITINGNLTFMSGDLDLNGDTITLASSAILNETAGNTVKGSSGVIRTTRDLTANPGNIALLGVDISSCPVLGVTTIERGHRPDTIGSSNSNSITRNYKITPINNSGLNATVSFYYDDSELNNLTESDLGLYNSIDQGIIWNSIDGTLNTTGNFITATAIESFSKWSLFSTTNPPTSVDEEGAAAIDIPKVYALMQNYPNPFNPATSISFDLPKSSYVVLKIYDIVGREIGTLIDGNLSAGRYTKTWNASSFSSGVYFYKIDARSSESGQSAVFSSIKKLLLVK